MKLKIDWFLVGMAAAVLMAWGWPNPGASGGWLQPKMLTKVGVALIFFLHGIQLPFEVLRAGTLRWPVHSVVQSSTFILFPLLGLALIALPGIVGDLRLGLFFLCVLPSTISSSVALTATARGNVPVAVFNATFSNLAGVLFTPLLVGLVMEASGLRIPFGEVFFDLVRWLVLPLLVGQLLRPWLGAMIQRQKRWATKVDRTVILLLVYTSFCESVKQGIWTNYGWGNVAMLTLVSLILFVVVIVVTRAVSRILKFPREEEIVVMFCGSQKTLAAGIPMAQLIFAGHPAMGLILLPIMIYHPLQLILCSGLASRWARRAN